jgi:hypothetical protein
MVAPLIFWLRKSAKSNAKAGREERWRQGAIAAKQPEYGQRYGACGQWI